MNSSSGVHTTNFRVVRAEGRGISIFEAVPSAADRLLDKEQDDVLACPVSPSRKEYGDGVFLLSNVLTKQECERIIQLSEEMGYTEDAPVSLGRDVRQNESCVWIMNHTVNRIIFERVQHLLPQSIDFQQQKDIVKPLVGLNRRWRFYKYNPTDVFKFHTDGVWTGSGVHIETGEYMDDLYHGGALSWLTFLIYLNDDFTGGSTKFLRPSLANEYSSRQSGLLDDDDKYFFNVQPEQGSVLCFFHGYHELSPLHEGALVTDGTKYVARTDVLYDTSGLQG